MEPQPPKKSYLRPLITGGTLILLLLAIAYIISAYDLSTMLRAYLESHIHPGIFIALMLVLPVLGMPISLFLVLVGMKFGIFAGILLSAAVMSVHMAVTYYLAHSFLRRWISQLLQSLKIPTPNLEKNYNRWHLFIFMIIPGLPYVVKNNVLAFTNVSFAPYMLISWTAQFAMSIPLIVVGGAVMEMDMAILGIAVGLLVLGCLLQYYLRKRYKNLSSKND